MKVLTRLYLVVFIALGFNPVYADTLKDYFSDFRGFKSAFIQKRFDAGKELLELTQGDLFISTPDKFRLVYSKPFKQVYVADGKQLWSYDEDLEQVIVKPQLDLLANTPAMILSNPKQLYKLYRVTQKPNKQGMQWFRLTPKNMDANFDAIELAFASGHLNIMELHDGMGQVTRLEFTSPSKNINLATSTFTFTVPKGVDVIRQ